MSKEWLSQNEEKELRRKTFDVSIKRNGEWELTVERLSAEELQERENSLNRMLEEKGIEDYSMNEAL